MLLVLGVVRLGLAVQQWRRRPGADDDVAAPRWMARITGMTWLTSLSIGAPVVAFPIAGDRMRGPLDRLREWMVRHNSAMMGVILLLVGMLLIGKALGAL